MPDTRHLTLEHLATFRSNPGRQDLDQFARGDLPVRFDASDEGRDV